MYDIDVKNIKKGIKFYGIFLLIGLAMLVLIVGFTVANNSKRKSLDSEVLSFMVDVNSHRDSDGELMYNAKYHYTVNGTNFVCRSNTSSSNNPGTENKTVYYDSKNPSRCMTQDSIMSKGFLALFIVIPSLFVVFGVVNIIKISKRLKSIKELNERGRLVKNLEYRLQDTALSVNNVPVKKIVVDYKLPSGSIVTLHSNPRHDGIAFDGDGMVDLVIDESNPDNYFIDFEINRISGNLSTDYYNGNAGNSYNNQNQSGYTDLDNKSF